MAQSEMKNAPPLYGWAIAVAAGAVATGVSFLVVGIEGNGSVAIGAVIALVVGVIFTIAETPPKAAAPALKPALKPAPKSTAAPASAPAPVAETAADARADAPAAEGSKPDMLTGPVGTADDLKQISGVGPVLESKLNELGVYHFWQIARWTPAEVAWVDDAISFKGRITRDDWITQASKLAETSASKPPA